MVDSIPFYNDCKKGSHSYAYSAARYRN